MPERPDHEKTQRYLAALSLTRHPTKRSFKSDDNGFLIRTPSNSPPRTPCGDLSDTRVAWKSKQGNEAGNRHPRTAVCFNEQKRRHITPSSLDHGCQRSIAKGISGGPMK
eukprot:4349500-Karenia_brevis.AAC.1